MKRVAGFSEIRNFAPIDWIILFTIISSIGWIIYQKRQQSALGESSVVPDSDSVVVTALPDEELPQPDEDEEAVKQNPGNHARVIRLILKSDSVGDIDNLYSDYSSAATRNKAFEIEVLAVYYLRKAQLLTSDERQKWYMGARKKIIPRHGYTEKQFSVAMSDAIEKYPGTAS